MFSTSLLLAGATTAALFTASTTAQCVTDGYVPCLPEGGVLGGVPSSSLGDSSFWVNLQVVVSDPVQKAKRDASTSSPMQQDRALTSPLMARQDALCCAPDATSYCLLITDGNIPFCYDSSSTEYIFSDESFGFINNGTYYDSAGDLVVDFTDGTFYANGSTSTFAPATVTQTQTMSATKTVSGAGKVTSLASGASGVGKGTGSGVTASTPMVKASGSGLSVSKASKSATSGSKGASAAGGSPTSSASTSAKASSGAAPSGGRGSVVLAGVMGGVGAVCGLVMYVML